MSLIARLKADYQARRRKVDVLGMEVWVTPLTVGENARLLAMHPDDGAMRMAETLVMKCRDADGKPIFAKEDKRALAAEVAGDALTELLVAITGPSVADAEKN
jgi:hypothetical protein